MSVKERQQMLDAPVKQFFEETEMPGTARVLLRQCRKNDVSTVRELIAQRLKPGDWQGVGSVVLGHLHRALRANGLLHQKAMFRPIPRCSKCGHVQVDEPGNQCWRCSRNV